MKNIWQKLKKPIFILAPMDDVTDTVFRQILSNLAAPNLYYTEFTSVDGLTSEQGRDAVSRRLQYTSKERPLIAQIWGNDPKKFYESAKLCRELGFDGIDINMGCPEKSVVKRGMCSGLINTPTLAGEIIKASKEGAQDLPVSVKTRLGMRQVQPEWIEFLLKQDLPALIIHGRTVKEMSKVPAHWDEIKEVVKLRDRIAPPTLIIGNGDVSSYEDGINKVNSTGVDGIMIGRGVFKNLWIFDKSGNLPQLTIQERLAHLLNHSRLFAKTWGDTKSFAILKKFYKIYISDFEGASELRARFMETKNLKEVEKLVKQTLANS